MRHIWTVLCQRSTVDADTDLISILNCLEMVNITLSKEAKNQEKVNLPIEYHFVSFWTRKEKEVGDIKIDCKIELVDPNNAVLRSTDQSFKVDEKYRRMRSRVNIKGLDLTIPGIYRFDVYEKTISGEFGLLTSLPLEVNIEYK